jgi:hypothetical protein
MIIGAGKTNIKIKITKPNTDGMFNRLVTVFALAPAFKAMQ